MYTFFLKRRLSSKTGLNDPPAIGLLIPRPDLCRPRLSVTMNTVSHFRESEKKWTNQGLWSYLRENSTQLDFCWQYRFFILWPPTSDSAGVPRPPKSDSAEAGPGMSAMASVQRQVHWPSRQRLWKSVENSVFLPPGCLCGLGGHWLRKAYLLPSLPSFWGPRAC